MMDTTISTAKNPTEIIEKAVEIVKNKVNKIKNSPITHDIIDHPIVGKYEHKDENGNWVEGPALGHAYSGGYDEYCEKHKSKLDKFLEEKGIL